MPVELVCTRDCKKHHPSTLRYFVVGDTGLLDPCAHFHARRGIKLCRPTMLVLTFDRLIVLLFFRRDSRLESTTSNIGRCTTYLRLLRLFWLPSKDVPASEGRMRRSASGRIQEELESSQSAHAPWFAYQAALAPPTYRTHSSLPPLPPLPGLLRLAPTFAASPSPAVLSGESIVSKGKDRNRCCLRTHKLFLSSLLPQSAPHKPFLSSLLPQSAPHNLPVTSIPLVLWHSV